MDIDLSFLSSVISELDYFFTNLARAEQIKDIDMRNVSSKKASETDEDISSTVVHLFCNEAIISLNVDTNENNASSTWLNNFYIMAKSLLYDKVEELISVYRDNISNQLGSYMYDVLGGALS